MKTHYPVTTLVSVIMNNINIKVGDQVLGNEKLIELTVKIENIFKDFILILYSEKSIVFLSDNQRI